MPLVEDFTAFFNAAEFASPATLAGVAITGIFDKDYASGDVGLSGMSSTQPGFTLASASVPAGVIGQLLVHAGVNYTVVEHQPDGTGVSVLLLERAP